MSVSETHNLANLRMTRDQSFAQLTETIRAVGGRAVVNASLSTCFGCPMEGAVAADEVWRWAAGLLEAGASGVTLADTTGMAHPAQVGEMVEAFRTRWPAARLTLHLHNTRGLGLANVLAALEAGADRFDASLGGLGGCPVRAGGHRERLHRRSRPYAGGHGVSDGCGPRLAAGVRAAVCPDSWATRFPARWPKPVAASTCIRLQNGCPRFERGRSAGAEWRDGRLRVFD